MRTNIELAFQNWIETAEGATIVDIRFLITIDEPKAYFSQME